MTDTSRKSRKLPTPELPGAEAWAAMAGPMTAAPIMGPMFAQSLETQRAILDELSGFWTHWLERRQKALQTAGTAASEMLKARKNGGGDVSAPQQALIGWCSGSVERIAEDGREASETATRCMSHLADAHLTTSRLCADMLTSSQREKEHATPL